MYWKNRFELPEIEERETAESRHQDMLDRWEANKSPEQRERERKEKEVRIFLSELHEIYTKDIVKHILHPLENKKRKELWDTDPRIQRDSPPKRRAKEWKCDQEAKKEVRQSLLEDLRKVEKGTEREFALQYFIYQLRDRSDPIYGVEVSPEEKLIEEKFQPIIYDKSLKEVPVFKKEGHVSSKYSREVFGSDFEKEL